jgi:hypothetical protein
MIPKKIIGKKEKKIKREKDKKIFSPLTATKANSLWKAAFGFFFINLIYNINNSLILIIYEFINIICFFILSERKKNTIKNYNFFEA